jgi:hypothetical protein
MMTKPKLAAVPFHEVMKSEAISPEEPIARANRSALVICQLCRPG